MTIRGRMGNPSGLNVGPRPAPVIGVAVRLDNLTQFRGVEFLIDTGASSTILHPRDAILVWGASDYLGHDFENDATLAKSGGVGGSADHIGRPATIVFLTEDGKLDQQSLDLSIARLRLPNPLTGFPGNLHLPSLLGRDILERYVLLVDGDDVLLSRET